MALRGEGDPRWVVKDRNDGRNVNGWHWEDKDVTAWASTRLKELLSSQACRTDAPAPGVGIASVDTVDGDATLYNRKGVLKVLFDLKISGKWTSEHPEEDHRTHGEFKLELFDEEPEVSATVDAKSRGEAAFRAAFLKEVVPKIQAQCVVFIREMHQGAGQSVEGLTLPKGKTAEAAARTTSSSRTEISRRSDAERDGPKSGQTEEVEMTEVFTCRPTDWFMGFTEERRLSAVMRGRARSEARVGGRWEVMGGTASGTFVKLVPGEDIEMRWRLSSWGEGAESGFAHVRLREEEGKTEARIVVRGVPKGKATETEGFWRVQVLQAMRVVMGWGSASMFS